MNDKIYNIIWRFCFAASCLLSLWALAFSLNHEPYIRTDFTIHSPNTSDRTLFDSTSGDVFIPCEQLSGRLHEIDYRTSKGTKVLVFLCFEAQKFKGSDGIDRLWVPHKIEDNLVYGLPWYSETIGDYVERAAKGLKMTKEEERVVEAQYWAKMREGLWSDLLFVVGANAIFWGLFYVMVWVFTGTVRSRNDHAQRQ